MVQAEEPHRQRIPASHLQARAIPEGPFTATRKY